MHNGAKPPTLNAGYTPGVFIRKMFKFAAACDAYPYACLYRASNLRSLCMRSLPFSSLHGEVSALHGFTVPAEPWALNANEQGDDPTKTPPFVPLRGLHFQATTMTAAANLR